MNRADMRTLVTVLALHVVLAAAWPASASAETASMKARLDLLFRLGFAGKIRVDVGAVGGSVGADTSPGVDLRGDLPIAKYVTLGPQVSIYAARPDFPGLDRNIFVDLSPFLKGRYPFFAGKKKAEVYGLFQVGFTMAFLRRSTLASDRFGPGWNIGLTPGFQIMLARRFGLVTEFGWLRTFARFDALNLIVNQAVWRFGFAF